MNTVSTRERERERERERHKTISYRPDIDGLRALAVLLVVGYHAFPGAVKGGFIGVDIFFVISGYLICGIILTNLQANEFSYRDFYYRRILRIFPALILVFLGVLIAGYICLLPDELTNLGLSVLCGGIFGENFLLWKSAGYFDMAAHAKPLLNLWSLGIEEQFYIIFPLLLSACWNKRLRIFTFVAILAIMSFTDCVWLRALDPDADYYSPLTRFWELFIGCMLKTTEMSPRYGTVREKINRIFSKIFYREPTNSQDGLGLFLAYLGLLCLGVAFLRITQQSWYPGWLALFPVCAALCLIGAGQTNFINHYFFSNKVAVFIGKISYPLYLWHWPILSFAWIINGHLDSSTRMLRIALMLVAFLLATLTYICVERPVRLKHCFGRASIPLLVWFMASCCCIGLCMYSANGFPERNTMNKYSKILKLLTPEVYINEAGLKFTGANPRDFVYCKYNDLGQDETIAIIGDSHGSAAYSGIANLGEQMLKTYGKGYNTLMLGYDGRRLFNPENFMKCNDIVSKHPEIKRVFLITRGMYNITGIDNRIDNSRGLNNPSLGMGHGKFRDAYKGMIAQLLKNGKEIVVLAENPELNYSVRSAIKRSWNGFTIDYDRLKLDKNDVLAWEKPYLDILKEIEDSKNADVLYLNDVFCPDNECVSLDENDLPLYFDDDHLSSLGSHFQAQKIIKPWIEKKILTINNENFD